MYAANAYTIRRASAHDVDALYRLAQLDSDPRPMTGRVLIGEIKGELAAAIAVADDRVIANPFRPTAQLVAHLRRRAAALRAAERTPVAARPHQGRAVPARACPPAQRRRGRLARSSAAPRDPPPGAPRTHRRYGRASAAWRARASCAASARAAHAR